MGQLIVVSNRVSVPERSASARAGGLEVAVNAALKERSGTWFGWSGKIATHGKIATQKVIQNDLTFITIDISREDHQEYYRGFANRVLWPIFHYRIDLAEFSRRDLSGYLRVNDNFARHLDKVLGPNDLVWVHDYHLLALAKALRERGHKDRIGFFPSYSMPAARDADSVAASRTSHSITVRLRSYWISDWRRRIQFQSLSHSGMRLAQSRFQFRRS